MSVQYSKLHWLTITFYLPITWPCLTLFLPAGRASQLILFLLSFCYFCVLNKFTSMHKPVQPCNKHLSNARLKASRISIPPCNQWIKMGCVSYIHHHPCFSWQNKCDGLTTTLRSLSWNHCISCTESVPQNSCREQQVMLPFVYK